MRALLSRLQGWLEVLGGERPVAARGWWSGVILGAWWALLFLVIFATIGRATKFIYVDF
jgi:hypothetical protein